MYILFIHLNSLHINRALTTHFTPKPIKKTTPKAWFLKYCVWGLLRNIHDNFYRVSLTSQYFFDIRLYRRCRLQSQRFKNNIT